MFKVYRDVYTVKVKTQPLSRRLGEIVTISYSRYGLSSGKQFVIVGLVEDYVSSTVEMELWG
jgi:ribosomal protein S17